jgi:hypothetical protein
MTSVTKLITVSVWALGLMGILAAPAAAQNPATAAAQDTAAGGASASRPRPIELSIGGAGVLSWLSSGGDIRAMVVVPIGERLSIDIFGGPYHGTVSDAFGEDVLAFYGAQVTRRIDRRRRPGFEPFLSFGAEGIVSRYREYYPCFPPGCGPHTVTHVLPPVVGLAGFGVQKALSPHLAMRIEIQGLVALVVPAGVRAGISLTMPIGQVYETPIRVTRAR